MAGAVALIFQSSPTMTQQQVLTRLTSSARSDAFTGIVPNNNWGSGKLDVNASV